MWRAFFLAIGISCCVFGVEAIALEKAVLNTSDPIIDRLASKGALGIRRTPTSGSLEIAPPEWAPWTLISAGVVVILYSFTIPKRVRG